MKEYEGFIIWLLLFTMIGLGAGYVLGRADTERHYEARIDAAVAARLDSVVAEMEMEMRAAIDSLPRGVYVFPIN